VNVNLLPVWIWLPIFLYILFIYIYVGVKGVTSSIIFFKYETMLRYHISFHGDLLSNHWHRCPITNVTLTSKTWTAIPHDPWHLHHHTCMRLNPRLIYISLRHHSLFLITYDPIMKDFPFLDSHNRKENDEHKYHKHMCLQVRLPSQTHFMTTTFYNILCNFSQHSINL